jgi:ABC-2 type transport system ATP-binding protein
MRMILGLDHPTAGTALVGNRSYAALRHPVREVGAVLDARAVHPGRSARNHLLAMARSNGIPARRVDEVLETVGLERVARKRAGSYSLGMSQRLGIAGALLGDPAVLIFDEPVNGLDPDGVRWVRRLTRSLAAEGRTVFVSSHLMSEMQLTADHLVVIGKGRLIADAPLAEVISATSGVAVRVRSPEAGGLAALGSRLRAQSMVVESDGPDALIVRNATTGQVGDVAHAMGVRLHGLHAHEASLEEAFMELTNESIEFGVSADGH